MRERGRESERKREREREGEREKKYGPFMLFTKPYRRIPKGSKKVGWGCLETMSKKT